MVPTKASVLYIFFKYCADVENCGTSKDFSFIYIYIYINYLIIKFVVLILCVFIYFNNYYFYRKHK